MVVNSTLAAIAKHGRKESTPDDENSRDYHVYQIASSVTNPLTLQHLLDMAYQYFSLNPCFDKKGNPIQISVFKFFDSIEDLLSHMENCSNSTTGNEMMSPRQELLQRKLMEHVKHLVNIYRPYTVFKGRYLSDFKTLLNFTKESRSIFTCST